MSCTEAVVRDWGDYYLRDDTEIRAGCPEFEGWEEAYSLFRRDPLGRVVVYAGSLSWAVDQAATRVEEERARMQKVPG